MVNLSLREKKALGICFVVLLAFLAVQFLLVPALDRKNKLETRITAKEAALSELFQLEKEYQSLEQRTELDKRMISRRDKNFTLFSFLDVLAEKSGVKEKVAYMKPSSRMSETGETTLSLVRVKVESLCLQELVDFMVGIETAGNGVYITSVSLSATGKEKKRLDAVIETETQET